MWVFCVCVCVDIYSRTKYQGSVIWVLIISKDCNNNKKNVFDIAASTSCVLLYKACDLRVWHLLIIRYFNNTFSANGYCFARSLAMLKFNGTMMSHSWAFFFFLFFRLSTTCCTLGFHSRDQANHSVYFFGVCFSQTLAACRTLLTSRAYKRNPSAPWRSTWGASTRTSPAALGSSCCGCPLCAPSHRR